MSDFLKYPVFNLEHKDYDDKGNLINPDIPIDKIVVVMLQASWCPHCTSAKPEFQKFANKYADKVFCATIQVDGDRDGEKKLAEDLEELIPGIRGFPEFLCYKKGKRQEKEITGRTVKDLEKFAEI